MNEKITLTVLRGSLEGNEFILDSNSQFLVGRGDDCDIRLPRDPGPLDISRHHCVLDTRDGNVYISDLGSLHGTYVNGEMIGQRPTGQSAEAGAVHPHASHELQDGDIISVGNILLRVAIEVSADVLQPAYFW
jgi:pSer/pThr/pTyr-binding forkhead associated (FHA) protein